MEIQMTMSEQAVPFVISYRQVIQKPKVERRRTFVGPIQLVKNALASALEFIEQIAFETKTNVIDPGKTNVVHWAISVEDPWDNAKESSLVAHRTYGDRPPCGAHFEIVSHAPQILEEEGRGRQRSAPQRRPADRYVAPAYTRPPIRTFEDTHEPEHSAPPDGFFPLDEDEYIDD